MKISKIAFNLKILHTFLTVVMLYLTSPIIEAAENISMDKADSIIMNFYRNPNYLDFITATSTIIEHTNDFVIYDFSTMVIDKHPEYVESIIKSFNNYSENEKTLLFTALLATHNNIATNSLKKSYHYTKPNVVFHTPEVIKAVIIDDNPAVLDALWAAYSATGNDKFPMKILRYINSDDTLLIISHELLNRAEMCKMSQNSPLCELSDLKTAIKNQYKSNPNNIFIKAVVISQAMRSYNTYLKENPAFQTKYKAIVKKDPKLDYIKKVGRMSQQKNGGEQ